MIKNYLKIAWRNLLRSKWYSSINIIGLSVGMAISLLIGLWIWDELSFDFYHSNHARLGEAMVHQTSNGQTLTGRTIAMPLDKALRTRYAGDLKYIATVSRNDAHVLVAGDKKLSGSGIWAQPDFPEMFTLNMIKGNREALKDPTTLLIAQSLATALFGDVDPMNRTVIVDNKIDLKIGGVYEDLPPSTTFYETKFLLPWNNKENWLNSKDPQSNWDNHLGQLFVQLNDHADFDQVSAKIKDISIEHKMDYKEVTFLYPIDKLHLYSEFLNGKVVGGRIRFVWLFGIIGLFVLLLACINFMNLSTARSERRAKEVGIRKAIGSLRGQLIGQFLCESLLVAFLALTLAIILVLLSLPFFNGLADKQMSIPWGNLLFWLSILGFTFFTGFVSGSYPAFYLSGFKPIKVLKGTFRVGRFASLPRKVMVIVQFTVSIALIIGTIIVFRQIQYAKARPVGYSKEGLITVRMNTPNLYDHYDAIRNDLIRSGAVADVAESNGATTEISSANSGFSWQGKDPNFQPDFGTISISTDFGHTIGWQVTQGRDFSRGFSTDSGAVVINEAAAKVIGFRHPVGETISYTGSLMPHTGHIIIGVVKNMVMESPYKQAYPVMFFLGGYLNTITIRIKPDLPVRDALARIQTVFSKYNSDSPFVYQFIDDEYAKKFSDEERVGHLASFFAILAIFISGLGLFGLASFVAEQRTKEIGLRKVLGASEFQLWKMLSKDFVMLVIISCIIAIPSAWLFMDQWLQRYEYRTGISWWIFAISGLGALLITLLTISYQAIRAALMNPVKSLRAE